jgi:hypothetical protein
MLKFNLKLTFNEAGTVYAGLSLAAEKLAEDAPEIAENIRRIARRLLPGGDAVVDG